MVDFRAGYVPPGVYVTADSSSVSTTAGVGPTVVLLVGPGLGSRSQVDYVTFATKTSSFTLSQQGAVNPSAGGLTVYSVAAGVTTTYELTTDYTVAVSGSGTETVTTVTAVSDGSIPTNTQIMIAYNYANDAYFALNQFSDFGSLSSVYGAPFSPSGTLQSPLSLAAQIAFDNGANEIYCIAIPNNVTGSGVASAYRAAYDQTLVNPEIGLIIPVFDSTTDSGHPVDMSSLSSFLGGLVAHLTNAEADGVPRNAILGVPETFDSSVTPDQIAVALDYRRVVFVWPNQLDFYNAYSTPPGNVVVGGQYLAAACAGVLTALPTNTGLTKQVVYSFSAIDPAVAPKLTVTNKNTWSSKGVAVLEANRLGQLTIRHGVTTDVSSVTSREFSIVRCQDELFNEIQTSLESAALIGTPIDDNTPLAVKSIVTGALETALGDETIAAYNTVNVRQQSLPDGDPSVIEVVFTYQPTYPLNYITVNFSYDLSTGAITDNSTDTTDTTDSGS